MLSVVEVVVLVVVLSLVLLVSSLVDSCVCRVDRWCCVESPCGDCPPGPRTSVLTVVVALADAPAGGSWVLEVDKRGVCDCAFSWRGEATARAVAVPTATTTTPVDIIGMNARVCLRGEVGGVVGVSPSCTTRSGGRDCRAGSSARRRLYCSCCRERRARRMGHTTTITSATMINAALGKTNHMPHTSLTQTAV